MRRILLAAFVLALAPAAGQAGPIHAEDTFQRYFRLEWQATPGAHGPEIPGYVEHASNLPVDRMRVVAEQVAAGGPVIRSSTTWPPGPVTPNPPTHFTTTPPA